MRLGAAKDGEFPSPWPQDGYGIGASQPLAPRMEAGRGLLRHLAPVWIAAGQPGNKRPASGCLRYRPKMARTRANRRRGRRDTAPRAVEGRFEWGAWVLMP